MEQIQRDLDHRISTHITQFEQESQELRNQINALETELSAICMDHTTSKEKEVVLLETVDTLKRQLAEQLAEQSAIAANGKNVQELQEVSARQEEERKASLLQALAQVDVLTQQLADSQQEMKSMEQQLAQKDEKNKEMLSKMMEKWKRINVQLEERTQELAMARSASTEISTQQLDEQSLREEQRKELENQLTLLEKQLTVVRAGMSGGNTRFVSLCLSSQLSVPIYLCRTLSNNISILIIHRWSTCFIDLLQSEATAATQARELTKSHESALQNMGERLQQQETINQQLLLTIEESKASFEQVTAQAASSEQVAAQLQSDLQVNPLSPSLIY